MFTTVNANMRGNMLGGAVQKFKILIWVVCWAVNMTYPAHEDDCRDKDDKKSCSQRRCNRENFPGSSKNLLFSLGNHYSRWRRGAEHRRHGKRTLLGHPVRPPKKTNLCRGSNGRPICQGWEVAALVVLLPLWLIKLRPQSNDRLEGQ